MKPCMVMHSILHQWFSAPQSYLRRKYPLWFFIYYVHHITQQHESRTVGKYVCIKVATMKSADSTVCFSYRLNLKYPFPFSVSYVQLVTQYESKTVWKAPLKSRYPLWKIQMISITQRKPSHAATKSTLFTVSKDEWNTKEGIGKSLKNTMHVLQYMKRNLSSWSDIEQWKIKPVALAAIELCLPEGRQSVRRKFR